MELYHSDEYLGKDYSDGLKHWKYIRRYYRNGKWRYVYADRSTHNKLKGMKYDADITKENLDYWDSRLFALDSSEQAEREQDKRRWQMRETKYVNELDKHSINSGKDFILKLIFREG